MWHGKCSENIPFASVTVTETVPEYGAELWKGFKTPMLETPNCTLAAQHCNELQLMPGMHVLLGASCWPAPQAIPAGASRVHWSVKRIDS